MKLFEKIKMFFKKEEDLRTKCIEAYGEEFGEIYDTLGTGGTVGDFVVTLAYIQMIEDVKNGNPKTQSDEKTNIKVTGIYIPEE